MNKGDHDGFQHFHPKAMYQEKWGEYKVSYDSGYAYYKRNIYKKIENHYPGVEKLVAYTLINSNANLVEDEVIYLDHASKTMIAIKLFWEVSDYKIDDGEHPQAYVDELEDMGPVPVRINKSSKFQAKISILSADTSNVPVLNKLIAKIKSKEVDIRPKEREMNIVAFSSTEGYHLKTFRTNAMEMSISDNYNDDFMEVSDNILSRLSTNGDNGIVLLHSDPGCGKTSYLRYLTQKITSKRIIYLPPDMAHKLADPDFMGFLMGYTNSVLFIEDAENCLQKRDSGGNQAVSNLLNNSCGLLGDAMKLQIICTFNCHLNQIDPALLRPGRLIAEYKFEKLSKDKTAALIKKLYGDDCEYLHRVEAMTLAEIYNLSRKKFTSKPKQTGIGFNRN